MDPLPVLVSHHWSGASRSDRALDPLDHGPFSKNHLTQGSGYFVPAQQLLLLYGLPLAPIDRDSWDGNGPAHEDRLPKHEEGLGMWSVESEAALVLSLCLD